MTPDGICGQRMLLSSLNGTLLPVELRWPQTQGFQGFRPWNHVTEDHARGLREEFLSHRPGGVGRR
jgi:hypothetical protein